MAETGFANGTLNPIIYFKRGSDGYVILAPHEKGHGLEVAHMLYDQRYRHEWQWCEAGTLREAQQLEKQLIEQAMREREHQAEVVGAERENVKKQVSSAMYARLVSSSTSAYEKEFIRCWMALSESKRDKYAQRLKEHNDYLWALQMDSGTKLEDRMIGDNSL
jgi:hypothetical protein